MDGPTWFGASATPSAPARNPSPLHPRVPTLPAPQSIPARPDPLSTQFLTAEHRGSSLRSQEVRTDAAGHGEK